MLRLLSCRSGTNNSAMFRSVGVLRFFSSPFTVRGVAVFGTASCAVEHMYVMYEEAALSLSCSEVVPEQLRSTVYAFDRSFEGAVGATAAPLVGALILCQALPDESILIMAPKTCLADRPSC